MSVFVAVAALLAAGAQGDPPTLDPTYGRPVPRNLPAAKAQPDAKWIWASHTEDTQIVVANRAFHVDAQPKSAALYVAVDNYMVVRLDGKILGRTAPNGDDMVWIHVQRFDVTSALNPGDHVIEIEGKNAGGAAGILARLQVNGKPLLLSDKSWQVMSLGSGDRSAAAATEEAGLGNGPWGTQLQGWPVPFASVPDYLHHLPMPAVAMAIVPDQADPDQLDWRPSNGQVDMSSPAPGKPWRVIFDFSRELSGRAEMHQTGLSGSIGCGESIGEAIQKPYTSMAFIGEDHQVDTPYSASRYACISFPASVTHAAFRIGFDHLYYPVTYRGSFDSSDPLLNKIWYTGAYTAHLCMQQDIWDAPKRDRARWMGDLHVSGEVINNVFLDRFLMEQTMSRLRADAQGGKPADQMPGGHVNGIPGYSCAWLCGLKDLYFHTGDLAYIKSQHQAILTMLAFMKTEISSDGIFANAHRQWPFVDWSPDFDKDTPQARAATHLFFIKAAREAAILLAALGDRANAAKTTEWADTLALNAQHYLVGDHQTFGNRRQENAMAVCSETATPLEKQAIYQQVLNLNSPSWKQVATPYYDNYVIMALSDLGHDQDVLRFVRSYWGGMIQEGATSFWEGYDPTWDKHNFHAHLQADDGTGYFVSLCHGWSAGVTDWLTERVLGIEPTGGGFGTCTIAPHLVGLAWVSGTVPTPNGLIRARFQRTKAGITGTLTIPKGVKATLKLDGKPIQVNGRRTGDAEPTLGPGAYRIQS